MSHTSTIDNILFVDIHAVAAAIGELNTQVIKCSLQRNATPRAFYANQAGLGPADYVIHLADCMYDVGLYYNKEKKGYEARADLYANRIGSLLGSTQPRQPGETDNQVQMGKLFQLYAIHAATRKAAQQGYTVRRVNKPDGSVRLVVNGLAAA